MATVEVKFVDSLTPSDPKEQPVLIVGKLANLKTIPYESLKCKLQPRVDAATYEAALATLQNADNCPLWLNVAAIATVPSKATRHNAPSRAHAISKIVKVRRSLLW